MKSTSALFIHLLNNPPDRHFATGLLLPSSRGFEKVHPQGAIMKLIQKITLLSLCFAFVHSIAASDLIVGGITNVDTPLITNVDTPLITNVDTPLTSLNLRISGRAVTFEIQPNTIYLIEVSEDLMKWSEHATLEVGDQKGGGTFTITDDSMDLPSTKFYRVKWWTNRS